MGKFENFLLRKAPVYGDLYRLLSKYYSAYGGIKSVVRSPYFHLAGALTAITWSNWIVDGWWNLSISILPNIVGFTLSGYAILMTIGNERFRKELAKDVPGQPSSAFMAINATFFHFLLLQIFAIVLALLARSRPMSSLFGATSEYHFIVAIRTFLAFTFWCIGYFIFMYALTLALAAAAAIFKVGGWFELALQNAPKNSDQGE